MRFKILTDDDSMHCNMYQSMYVQKNYTLMGVFTNYGIGIFFFGVFVCLTKSAALSYVGLPIAEQARSEPRGRNQNNS